MRITIPQFLDGEGNIRPDLLDDEAWQWAGVFKRDGLTTHQVRKFYDEVKKYKDRLDKPGESYQRVKPLIVMLKSKAKYAATKKPKMASFYEFMKQSIDQIKTEGEADQKKKFNAFCLFFEAVYGFAELKEN